MGRDSQEEMQKRGFQASRERPGGGAPGGGSGGRGRGDGPPPPPVPAPPAGGYFEADGALKLYYVSKSTLDPLAQRFRRDNLKMNQLRRFYNHCANIRTRLHQPSTRWNEERVNIVSLTTFTASASGRDNGIPISFRNFIDDNVAMIHTQRDFVDGFMKYFEGVVGFSSLYLR